MKKNIAAGIRAVVFLLIFAYLFVHISYMVRGGLAHTRNNLSGFYDLEKDSLDVVFIGTSGTMSAFAPENAWEKYGFASYNFCINVMGSDVMQNALREVMKTQSPQLVVIDVYPFIIGHRVRDLSENYARYNTDGYHYSLDRVQLIRQSVSEDVDKLSYYFDIIKYHENPFEWKNFFAAYPFVNKGYNFMSWGAGTTAAVLTQERSALEEEYDAYLDGLLQECDDTDAEILFIYYPYGKVRDGDAASVNYINDRVETKGYPFLNCLAFQDQFHLDYDKDYWNGGHFDIYGAEKVTDVVGGYLQEHYHLPDRREDPAYAQWNDDLWEWHRLVLSNKDAVNKAIQEAAGQQ